jgi:flagellar biosynthesis/type III secretory pathway protein FliH
VTRPAWTGLTAAAPPASPIRSFASALAERAGPVGASSLPSWLAGLPAADAGESGGQRDSHALVAPLESPEVRARASDLAAAHEAATVEGRAAGLRETEELRQRLATAVAACERATAARADRDADQLADAAVAVIEAWLGTAAVGPERFAPILRGWLAATGDGGGATAHANPADVAGVRAAVGEAKLAVVEDARVAPGDLRISAGTLEVDHRWAARLVELREAIAAELVRT